MRRHFMLIPEAVELVLHAAALGEGDERAPDRRADACSARAGCERDPIGVTLKGRLAACNPSGSAGRPLGGVFALLGGSMFGLQTTEARLQAEIGKVVQPVRNELLAAQERSFRALSRYGRPKCSPSSRATLGTAFSATRPRMEEVPRPGRHAAGR
jgi:hypothetical protein